MDTGAVNKKERFWFSNSFSVQIHSGLSGENIGLLPPTDVKFSVSIHSDRRDVNRDYIVEYVSDLNGFRVKVEIAQRGLEPGLRGFGGRAADGGALSPDTLKSGQVRNEFICCTPRAYQFSIKVMFG